VPVAIHEFGPFRYDDSQRTIFRDGEPLPLQPKTFETFAALFERRGQVVDKADLIKLVWPDTTVEETGLARNISQLRKALGDEAEEYVETVPKRGYRFRAAEPSAPPAPQTQRGKRKQWLWAALLLTGVALLGGLLWQQFYEPSRYVPDADLTLAVLPFEEMSPELKAARFADGMTELLHTGLSRLPRTNLIAASVIARYAEKRVPVPVMTRLLRLDAVVEGSAQLENGTVRVNARITDVRSGRLIWSNSIERPAASLLAAQSAAADMVEAGARQKLR
jgi:DNA-binding winged helix-turn-helix (wHTH) protein/TolB-like protein